MDLEAVPVTAPYGAVKRSVLAAAVKRSVLAAAGLFLTDCTTVEAAEGESTLKHEVTLRQGTPVLEQLPEINLNDPND